ncbi:MAG: hypothetical protein CFE45_13745 [Burkholderiales bacterium PBB5]|nr:MAG: hypothetical protein CFE45_13745 [Burkholderiales bacterium PBB5]
MRQTTVFKSARTLLGSACLLACIGAQATTITIFNRDPAGVGFNDETPVLPVGGNTGTTLGQQRLNVYKHVAAIWEAAIQSNVEIVVSAGWEALTCTATSATLGSAGAWNIWRDFPGATPNRWYPQALANKIAGVNLTDGIPDDGTGYGNADIKTQFNVNLGNTGCLDGTPFYLGLDGNAGSKVNFATTLLHELGHGLGFSVLTVQTSTGRRLAADGSAFVTSGGVPSVWEPFMFDNTTGKAWLAMTNAERQASAINPLKLAWTGANAVAGAAGTLVDTPVINITSSLAGVSGKYDYAGAAFGPAIVTPSALGKLAYPGALTNAATFDACNAFTAAQAAVVVGKVAIVDRGTCTFVVKVKNAQNAGATAVLVADNAPGAPATLGGSDSTITIPAARITQAAGVTLKAAAGTVMRGSRSMTQPAHGAVHQQRPDQPAGAAQGPDQAAAARHRLVNPVRGWAAALGGPSQTKGRPRAPFFMVCRWRSGRSMSGAAAACQCGQRGASGQHQRPGLGLGHGCCCHLGNPSGVARQCHAAEVGAVRARHLVGPVAAEGVVADQVVLASQHHEGRPTRITATDVAFHVQAHAGRAGPAHLAEGVLGLAAVVDAIKVGVPDLGRAAFKVLLVIQVEQIGAVLGGLLDVEVGRAVDVAQQAGARGAVARHHDGLALREGLAPDAVARSPGGGGLAQGDDGQVVVEAAGRAIGAIVEAVEVGVHGHSAGRDLGGTTVGGRQRIGVVLVEAHPNVVGAVQADGLAVVVLVDAVGGGDVAGGAGRAQVKADAQTDHTAEGRRQHVRIDQVARDVVAGGIAVACQDGALDL